MMKVLFTLLVCIISHNAYAQGTIEDYKRAFEMQTLYSNKIFYSNVNPHWLGNSNRFWYVRNTPTGKIYTIIDADNKTRNLLFDHLKMAELLAKSTNKKIELEQLTLQSLRVSNFADTLWFNYDEKKWIFHCANEKLIELGSVGTQKKEYWGKVDTELDGKPIISPDKKSSALIREYNIYIKDLQTGVEKQISTDGTKDAYYSTYPFWSPDSKKIAVMRIRPALIPQLYLLESSPTDQNRPKLHTRDYLRPGDSLPFRTPVIFDLSNGFQKIATTLLFDSQMDLRGFEWFADSKSVMFEYNQRGHKVYRVLEMSVATGDVKTLINETSTTFVNYNRYYKKLINNEKEIIWMSERDNHNHLYIYDRATGKVKSRITKGEWYVRDIINVDEKNREIIFSANGLVPNEDPYLVRYYSIRFDGSRLKCLSPEQGMHQAWFSENKLFFVDVYSSVNKAPLAVLRNARNGKVIMPLEKVDITELVKTGWVAPEPFAAKGRDGETDIWGIIQRPSNFDPTKKYPIIEYIYAGPGSQYVPKTFIPYNYAISSLAELGFIVVQIDGMGTSFRSKKFEDICYKNLKDAGFPDRIAWTKTAATIYPYMDIERIGIFGASAGGQEAMSAVLFHPEHYKAAYSSCGCHDNRMDKIWWNEQWMSFPIDKSYIESSNVANAHLLTRPLMLVVGELDDNVDPASTYQVCNELIKANKNFELVVLPGVGHTMGNEFGEHKRFDFFVRNLMEIVPPDWDKVLKFAK